MLVPRTNIRQGGAFPPKELVKFTTSWGILKPLKWISNGLALGGILFFTTNGNITTNRILQSTGWAPTPSNSRKSLPEFDENKYDSFFARQSEFGELLTILKDLNINPKTFTSSNDGVIFDTRKERQKARELLSEKALHSTNEKTKSDTQSAIDIINRLDILDQFLFGVDGLDPERFYQGGVPNCQVLAAVKGLCFTKANRQELKSLIEVTSYCLEKDNFYINTIVHLNGEEISVPYSKIREKMSPRDYTPTSSTDGSLAFPILAYAIEEAANNYDSIPHLLQSTSPILLTGKDYVSIATWSLNNDELKDLLRLAPNTPITVGSYMQFDELTISNLKRQWNEKFNKPPVIYSPQKEEEFIKSMQQRVNEIESSTKNTPAKNNLTISLDTLKNTPLIEVTAITPPVENRKGSLFPEQTGQTNRKPLTSIVSNHQYAIKSFDGNEIIVTDSHGVEYEPLDLESFRRHMFIVVLPRENVPITDSNSTVPTLLLLISLLLVRKGINGLNRKMYSEYRSFFEKGISYLRRKISKDTEKKGV